MVVGWSISSWEHVRLPSSFLPTLCVKHCLYSNDCHCLSFHIYTHTLKRMASFSCHNCVRPFHHTDEHTEAGSGRDHIYTLSKWRSGLKPWSSELVWLWVQLLPVMRRKVSLIPKVGSHFRIHATVSHLSVLRC